MQRGKRRYVESLSSYARQFLEKMNKPDVDYMAGLAPSMAIEQKQEYGIPARLLEQQLKYMII